MCREDAPGCDDFCGYGQQQCPRSVLCSSVLAGAGAEAEDAGRVTEGLVTLLPQRGISGLRVIVAFSLFPDYFWERE